MSLVIGTNTSAQFAQDELRANQHKSATAMQRLATGLRINSARDDAAGLAISQSMTSQIRGLNQAVRNINDGVNLLQTAEGGLGAITDMLQRMRELAVQSANGTYSGSQRAYLQKEAAALQEQISKVVDTTTWNDKKLLDGSFTGQKIQVGAAGGTTMDLNIPSATISDLGMAGTTVTATVSVPTTTTTTSTVSSTTYGQFVVQFAYSGVTPVMFNARLNANTGQLLTALDSAWASATNETSKTSIRLSDFVYGGNGGPPGHGHITVAPGGIIPNETVNIDYTGDVYPWGSIYVNYQYTDGLYTIKNVGSVNSSLTSITAKFNSGLTTATNPSYVPTTTTTTSTTYQNVTTTTTTPGLDISSGASASASISVIDAALDTVNSIRSTIGGYANRLNYAGDNATNISTNLSASRSAIQDTDYAEESANLAKSQIVQQAATAMLAQANQQPQSVLALLKNL
jgi:flagellin